MIPDENTNTTAEKELEKFEPRPGTSDTDLENIFLHHAPVRQSQIAFYQAYRIKVLELAKFLRDHTPPSREQSLALTNLEQVNFYGVAACARNADKYACDPPTN